MFRRQVVLKVLVLGDVRKPESVLLNNWMDTERKVDPDPESTHLKTHCVI